MSEEAARRIREAILEHGPIPFAEYMERALYGPGGFYERQPVGPHGDFVTGPHVHPVFSRFVGLALEELWGALGRPRPLRLIEVGAGDGTLARELIDGFARGGVELSYVAVEASVRGRQALSALAGLTVVERLVEAGPLEAGVVFANELLDNLPFRRVRRRGGELLEVVVGLKGDRLVELERRCEDTLAALTPPLDPEEEAAVPVGGLRFVDELADTLEHGYALLIDYGAEDGPAGPVHGYRGHRVLEDVLEDPGSADITAGVDLGAVIRRAQDRGLHAFAPVSQRAALLALGFEDWEGDELARQRSQFGAGRGLEAVRTWGARSRARLLVERGGLGRLRWLLLATRDLPAPGWLERASELRAPAD